VELAMRTELSLWARGLDGGLSPTLSLYGGLKCARTKSGALKPPRPWKFDKQKWTQVRARGHARFIMSQGLLRWGGPFGFVVTLGPFFYDLARHSPTPSIWSMLGSLALLTLIFGYGMGEREWRLGERAYHENAA